MDAPLIYLIAGEASGDALGADLMRALKAQCREARFAGIGGEAMTREGLKSLFPYSDLSVMGFLEIVPHIPKLLRRLRETERHIVETLPDCIVTIDSPGFTFRLAKRLKANPLTCSIPRIHYVAPSVWAYKPERAAKTAVLFDLLLTLLPFEPAWFEKEGLKTVFAGHPVLWDKTHGDGGAFRTRHTIGMEEKLLLLLPGSRMGEVKRHLPIFLEAAHALPSHKIAILAGAQVKDYIRASTPPDIILADFSEKKDAFAAANLALSKSGTVTLELAAASVPMVVAYKVSSVSAWIIRRMANIPYASLVNIAVQKYIVPEFLQERCTAPLLAQALLTLSIPEAIEQQRQDCAEALKLLRGKNASPPGMKAAEAILQVRDGEKCS